MTRLCCVVLPLQMRSSLRPPTPSLQHSVQLHTAQAGSNGASRSLAGSSIGGSSACSTTTSLGGAAATAWSALGGPGCPTAGTRTKKGEWDAPLSPGALPDPYQQQQQQQRVQQVQSPTDYGRGTGIKGLIHGHHPAEPYSHSGYQQALMASAANPAPPRVKAGPLPPPAAGNTQQHSGWQQQQQCGPLGGSSYTSAQERCGDSLDRFVGGTSQRGDSQAGTAASVGTYGSTAHSHTTSSTYQAGRYGSPTYGSNTTGAAGRQQYSPSPPYGAWEPRAGSLLPQDSGEADRVSLRRQAAQKAEQYVQQQRPQWQAAGAGPPGHLLASPLSTYAVPTAEMAGTMGDVAGHQEQQQQQRHPSGRQSSMQGGGSRNGRQQASSLCLSWDGLPTSLVVSQQAGKGQGGVYGSGQWGSSGMSESRIAAASARSGSGAASCMRMV
jgi:hypothetical protein